MPKRHETVLMFPLGQAGDVRRVGIYEFARVVGDLRYDRLGEYLSELAGKLQSDSESDGGRGRGKLAAHLQRAAFAIDEARLEIEAAWKICEPYMKPDVVTAVPPCVCGHERREHLDEIAGGARWCDAPDCPCTDYKEKT